MKNENNKQRNSAPTGAQDSSTELNADRPLGGAACSASSFIEVLEEQAKAGKLGKPVTYNPKELDALVASGKCYFSDVYIPPKNRTNHRNTPC